MQQLFGNALLGNGLGQTQSNLGGLGGLLSGGLKCTQNEQRLMQEKSQRNLLKKYLTQATGDPIQSALISSTIPGRGAGDTFDVGLGTRSSILQSLGLNNQPTQNTGLLGSLNTANQGLNLMNSLGGANNSTLGNLSTLGNIANLGKSSTANTGLLSSLVSLASTPNNNGNILSNLGGLGTGFIGQSTGNTGGLLGNIQSGMNTLNTLNKVNNAVSGIKNLF